MITIADLHGLAASRLADAEALSAAGRYAGAVYLCGYAVELVVKARICRTLGWDGWPDAGEFGKLGSFKTHDLTTLLHVSGVEIPLKADPALAAAWLAVAEWDPETRYKLPDNDAVEADATTMVESAKILLGYFQQ